MMMVLAFAGFSNMQAQEIYTEVMNMAKERVNDPAASDIVKEINQFKVNALTYMALTMREKMPTHLPTCSIQRRWPCTNM